MATPVSGKSFQASRQADLAAHDMRAGQRVLRRNKECCTQGLSAASSLAMQSLSSSITFGAALVPTLPLLSSPGARTEALTYPMKR
jgi:hypothetical protein